MSEPQRRTEALRQMLDWPSIHLGEWLQREAEAGGFFGVRLAKEQAITSDEWTKVEFDEVVWDTAGAFDLQRSAFVAPRLVVCGFPHGGKARR